MRARENRQAIVDLYLGKPELGTYEPYATTGRGSKEIALRVSGGKVQIENSALLKKLVENPKSKLARIEKEVVTESVIRRVAGGIEDESFRKKVVAVLEKHRGRTWEEAVEAHAGGSE